MDFNLKSLAAKELKPKERPTEDISDVRHRAMMEAIAPYAKKVVVNQKNLTPVYVDYKTRETKMVLVLCPEWSPHMPPFSLARLSGVAKASGYETHIMDLNVKAYNAFRDNYMATGHASGATGVWLFNSHSDSSVQHRGSVVS